MDGALVLHGGAEARPPAGVAFDYSALPAEVATEARAVAERVRARHQRQIAAIIETGRDLTAIKERLEHGQFLAWIEAEFGMVDRTARNYMQAAARFDGKSEIISDLPPTAVYQLAAPSTPEPIREAVIQRLEAGERVAPDEIRDMLSRAKEQAKLAKQEARQSPDRRKRRERLKERRAKEREREQQEEAARAAREKQAAREVAELIAARFGDDFPALADLMEEANLWRLREEVRALRKGGS